MKIISQRYIGDGQFMLQLGGLSSETKPTDAFVATGSQFFEDDTDAVFTFSGLTWNLEKNGQMKDLPVVTATDNGKVLKVANGVWSVGEGGSGGGGGAEKFVVTLTQENDTWTADKTIAEILAADAANQIVVCKVSPGGGAMPYELPLTTAVEFAGGEGYVSVFAGVIMSEGGNDSATVFGSFAQDQTNWLVTTTPIPTSTNAPLIVTLTADAQTGNFVGDKTYKEVYDAFIAGTTVVASIAMTVEGNQVVNAFVVSGVGYMEGQSNEYNVMYSATSASTSQGSANNYLTITLGD